MKLRIPLRKALQTNLISEIEMPGQKVSTEQLRIICSRYYFASQFVQGKRVLEVGCGPGLGLGYLAGRAERVIGGDFSNYALRCAQEHYKGGVELISLNAYNLPFKDGCFDVVVAMAVAYRLHMDDFLRECHRVLSEEGILVFCIPNKDVPSFRGSPLSHKYYSVPELSALLSQHHFDAKLFGAFPIPIQGGSTRQKLRSAMITYGGKILDFLEVIPKGRGFREFLNRIVLSKTLVLKEEIEDGMVEKPQLAPLRFDYTDFQHRILYASARAR